MKNIYTNPIIYADYSDPDAIRVGEDYFMTASSFCNTPGLPILHSKDLVHWNLINYALRNVPGSRYEEPRHGCGVWAPAIRFHKGRYYIFFPMPDEGIYVTETGDPYGSWSEPRLLIEGRGLIDPCPLWDEDGRTYMVHAYAKSRAGIKSVLDVAEIDEDCTRVLSPAIRVFDGNYNDQVTIEGPKLYKRNGYYYIFAPAGGVKQGWQVVLRSHDIYGPYEYRVVMEQKNTEINGPHQGAWVDTAEGEDFFIHFRDVYAGGRIVYLEPLTWREDEWPVIGDAEEDEVCGRPVEDYRMPVRGIDAEAVKAEDLRKSEGNLYLPGQDLRWNADHAEDWAAFDRKEGAVVLYAQHSRESITQQPNLLLKMWTAPAFTETFKMDLADLGESAEAGIINMGMRYGALTIRSTEDTYVISRISGEQKFDHEQARGEDHTEELTRLPKEDLKDGIRFRYEVVRVPSDAYNSDGKYIFPIPKEEVILSYGTEEGSFTEALRFTAAAGRWVGVKYGFFVRGQNGSVRVCPA